MASKSISELVRSNLPDLTSYEEVYKHFHQNPELSHLEKETSATVAEHLSKLNVFEIYRNIGGHGLAAVMKNGDGKTIMLRADMDALPVKEDTGLSYASTKTMADQSGVTRAVMHACGHDMHMTCLLAAAEFLVSHRDVWSGTLILVFQPEEERGTGARAMVAAGLYDRVPIPDFVLGQHVMAMPAGTVGCRSGTIMAAADSYKITLYGRGGHGSMPHMAIDPVLMASNLIVRLQTIVSREVDPSDMAVVTVGSLSCGHTENIISDRAEIGLDIRSIKKDTRDKVIASIKRMVHAEYIASGAGKPPEITQTRTFPTTDNDDAMAARLATAFTSHFGDAFNSDQPRVNASEDVSILASSVGKPSLFWFWGGTDPVFYKRKMEEGRLYEDVPSNHSPFFAPVVQPTLRIGVETLCVAALTFFGAG